MDDNSSKQNTSTISIAQNPKKRKRETPKEFVGNNRFSGSPTKSEDHPESIKNSENSDTAESVLPPHVEKLYYSPSFLDCGRQELANICDTTFLKLAWLSPSPFILDNDLGTKEISSSLNSRVENPNTSINSLKEIPSLSKVVELSQHVGKKEFIFPLDFREE